MSATARTPDKQTTEMVRGTVKRVLFHSPADGACALVVKSGIREYKVTGYAQELAKGAEVEVKGVWENHPKWGPQFKAEMIVMARPETRDGIERFLSSSHVKGIGKKTAKQLVDAFGSDVFRIAKEEPQLIQSLPGIGKVKAERIIAGIHASEAVRDIIVFLRTYGMGPQRAMRIYKVFGDKAIVKIKEDPYLLVEHIPGIGFKLADDFALRMGVSTDDPMRLRHGLEHVLEDSRAGGDCGLLEKELLKRGAELLAVAQHDLREPYRRLIDDRRLIVEIDAESSERVTYSAKLWHSERAIAKHIGRLTSVPGTPWDSDRGMRDLAHHQMGAKMRLSLHQRAALEVLLNNRVSIITGGPGTGKTSTLRTLLEVLIGQGVDIALCAPTGRAAMRMTESLAGSGLGLVGQTVHRLLQFRGNGFEFNEDNPLPHDLIIVDESSMLDVPLTLALVRAVRRGASIVFVGDRDQLPSVGPGQVLADMQDSGRISYARLRKIFRQAAESGIIRAAHAINAGHVPQDTRASDYVWLHEPSNKRPPQEVAEATAQRLIHRVIPRLQEKGFNPMLDVQIITPMHKGPLGTQALNIAMQAALNPEGRAVSGTFFRVGDRVVQMRNNYNKEVFNGEMGYIRAFDAENEIMQIEFSGGLKEYEVAEADELNLAYAISVHKSQGSEFAVIIVPVSTQHFMMLERQLLYTAVTRGKSFVVLIGSERALKKACETYTSKNRTTTLRRRLEELVPEREGANLLAA